MNTLLKYLLRRDVSRAIWLCGLAMTGAGEVLAASNDEGSDTISEAFRDQSMVAKLGIFLFIGAVLSHLAQWIISPKDSPK